MILSGSYSVFLPFAVMVMHGSQTAYSGVEMPEKYLSRAV